MAIISSLLMTGISRLEREKDNNLGNMSTLFEGIDISEFPETAEEIPSSEDTAAAK